MDVAEGDDHVGRAWRGDLIRARPKVADRDAAISFRMRGESLRKRGEAPADVGIVGTRYGKRCIVFALILEKGREDLGIPARLRPDLHHLHLRSNAKEEQRFFGMAVQVARTIGLRAARVGNDALKCRRSAIFSVSHARRGCAGDHHQRNRKSGYNALKQCGPLASEWTAALARTLRTLLRFVDS